MTFKNKLKKFFHCNHNKETEQNKRIKPIVTKEELLQKIVDKLKELDALINQVDTKNDKYLMSIIDDFKRCTAITVLRDVNKKVSPYMRKTPPSVQYPEGQIGFTMKGVTRPKSKTKPKSNSKPKPKSNKPKNNERRNNKSEGNTRGKQ